MKPQYGCVIPDCPACELWIDELEEKIWNRHVTQALSLLVPEEKEQAKQQMTRALRRHPAVRSYINSCTPRGQQ